MKSNVIFGIIYYVFGITVLIVVTIGVIQEAIKEKSGCFWILAGVFSIGAVIMFIGLILFITTR